MKHPEELDSKGLAPNIGQVKICRPKIVHSDVMCIFSGLVQWHHSVWCISKLVCRTCKTEKIKNDEAVLYLDYAA